MKKPIVFKFNVKSSFKIISKQTGKNLVGLMLRQKTESSDKFKTYIFEGQFTNSKMKQDIKNQVCVAYGLMVMKIII